MAAAIAGAQGSAPQFRFKSNGLSKSEEAGVLVSKTCEFESLSLRAAAVRHMAENAEALGIRCIKPSEHGGRLFCFSPARG